MPVPTYCARHPETETSLRCGRCDTPICPECLVHAPVGVRCPDCGKATKLPTYTVSRRQLAFAVLTSVALGVVGGVIVAFLVRPLLFGLLYVAAMGGFGYLVSEAIGVVSNHRRGRAVQIVAASGVVVAMATVVTVSAAFTGVIDPFDLIAGGLGVYVAVVRLR